MIERSKIQTLSYVFLLTVVPQLIVLSVFGSTCFFALRFGENGDLLTTLIGVVAFIAMLFAFLCTAIFCKNYGLSVFSPTRKNFNVNEYHGAPIKKIEYHFGRKNVFTGKRPIYVQEKTISTGGPLLVTAFISIIIGLTGILKFVFEGIRVLLSDDRQSEWEGCREYLNKKRELEGSTRFFNIPIIVLIVFCLSWALTAVSIINDSIKYNPDHLEIDIYEIQTEATNFDYARVYFYGDITNKGKAKVETVSFALYIKDKENNLIFRQSDFTIKAPFSVHSHDDSLENEETWSFSVNCILEEEYIQNLLNKSLHELEISIDIEEIKYETGRIKSFPEEELIIIKPIKNK